MVFSLRVQEKIRVIHLLIVKIVKIVLVVYILIQRLKFIIKIHGISRNKYYEY